jgi:glutaminyl-peptide cyclotransferase
VATKKRSKRRPKGAKGAASPTRPARESARTEELERRVERHAFKYWPWLAGLAVVAGIAAWQLTPETRSVPEAMRARVIRSFPHDRQAFTQGLLWHGGKLYESTGLHRQSTLRRVDPETGEVEQRVELPDEMFAEGLARVGDELVQLTWQDGKALVWSIEGLTRVREHEYRGEGWGLCFDGERLIMSDGTDWLAFRDPETFERIGEVRVTRAGRPLRKLNELECADGAVYANVWTDDHIARIDPETGEVTAWIDASGLLSDEDRRGGEDVLNGIAYVPETGHFLLTGKNWPRVYEVEFVPAE